MDSGTLFDPIPWHAVGVSALQTFLIYWFAILGLRLVGRRAFGELGPQDIVLLLLLSEGLNSALVPQGAGFWGGVASALTLLVSVGAVERIRPLREALDGTAVDIVIDGQMLRDAMRRYQVDESDVMKAAREYGVAGPEAFERAVLEGDGSITAVLKTEYTRQHRVGSRSL